MNDQGRFPPNFFLAVADSRRQRNQSRLVMIWKRKYAILRNRKRFLGGCDGVQKRDNKLPGLAENEERKENLESTLPSRFMRVFNVDLIFFWRYWRLSASNINHRWHSQYPSAVWLHNQHCRLATSWFVMKCLNMEYVHKWMRYNFETCPHSYTNNASFISSGLCRMKVYMYWYTRKHTLELIVAWHCKSFS